MSDESRAALLFALEEAARRAVGSHGRGGLGACSWAR